MKIICEFESYEEMEAFTKKVAGQVKAPVTEAKDTSTEEVTVEEVEVKDEPVEEPSYTLVDVRAKLAELQKAGKRDGVKKLLESFGASKLTDVPENKYGELMEKAGEL